MADTSVADRQATFCATLVDEWVRAGVTRVAMAPGSRSTPLIVAAGRHPRIELSVHIDERSAAFAALGMARASGRPAVVITTSGTAVANLAPAVIEADADGVALLVCTADRPRDLWGTASPQTIDQDRIFGRAVRWYAAPGVAGGVGEEAPKSWRALAGRAVAEAVAGAGPVHLDLEMAEPLLGTVGELPAAAADGGPWITVAPASAPVGPELIEGRGLLIVDRIPPAGRSAVVDLAAAGGWPILATARAGLSATEAGNVVGADLFLRDPAIATVLMPDVTVELVGPPTGRATASFLAASGARRHAVGHRHLNPDHRPTHRWSGSPEDWCRLVRDRVTPSPEGWGERWRAASAAAAAVIAERVEDDGPLTEPALARAVVAALPTGANLVVSSSMPIRDVEWFAIARDDIEIHANRGANGIDGVVSTALGVAMASGAPTVALVGDLALLHDQTALIGLADRAVDLAVVVVDNDGGGIFSFLPQATSLAPEAFEFLFGTPHGTDLAALARAHGLPAARLEQARDVAAVLGGASGPRVAIARTDRAANVDVHRQIGEAVVEAVRAAVL